MQKIMCKSLSSLNKDDFIELIKQYAVDTEGLEVYKAIAYSVGIDRDGEVAEQSFIEQLAEKIIGKPVIKNHDWHDVDGTVGTIIKSEVIGEDLLVYFYVADDDVKDKLNKGIYKGVSCGFEPITAVIDEVLHLVGCKDAFEMSLVTVPAVPKASIKIKSLSMKGEEAMPFKILRKQKLLAKYASLKQVEPEALDELAGDEVEITEADIENLLAENETLKAKVAELENQISEYKESEVKAKSKAFIINEAEKAIKGLKPTTEAEEVIIEEAKEAVEKGELVVEYTDDAEVVKGLDKFIDKVKVKYMKLEVAWEDEKSIRLLDSLVAQDGTGMYKDFYFVPNKREDWTEGTAFKCTVAVISSTPNDAVADGYQASSYELAVQGAKTAFDGVIAEA